MSRVRGLLRRKGLAEDAQPERRVEAPEEIPGIIDTYRVPAGAKPEASAEVFVVEQEGVGRYLVRPPKLSEDEAMALEVLRVNLLDSIPTSSFGNPREVVADYVWRTAEEAGFVAVAQESHDKLLYFLLRDFAGFWEKKPEVCLHSLVGPHPFDTSQMRKSGQLFSIAVVKPV